MKCCVCGKELDVSRNAIPPKWYGMYVGDKMVKVICDECSKDEKRMERYRQRDE